MKKIYCNDDRSGAEEIIAGEASQKLNFQKNVNSISSEHKVCSFFSKYRYCKYGSDCKFIHDRFPSKYNGNFSSKSNENVPQSNLKYINSSSSLSRNKAERITDRIFTNRRRECRYFKAGSCEKGDFCPYKHTYNDNQNLKPLEGVLLSKNRRVPICHYFKKGNCHRGEECKFYHQVRKELNKTVSSNLDNELTCKDTEVKMKDQNSNGSSLDSSNCKNSFSSKTPMEILIKKFYDLALLSENELMNLRDTEIKQLKKRYPGHNVIEEKQTISFVFEPTDPDWPFDLKSLELQVHFPEKYPVEVCKICVVNSSSNIPDILLRYLNQCIKEWIEKRHGTMKESKQVELVFRPFLKWFDKSLEDLFICGLRKVKRDIEAKSDGIEYVPAEELFSSANECKLSEQSEVGITEEKVEENLLKQNKNVNENQSANSLKIEKPAENTSLKQGVKVLFNGMELVEGVAALSCTMLTIAAQCIRCKTPWNVKCTPNKTSISKCSKCSKLLECTFTSSLLHQFSNVVGNLNVIECQVVDINVVESSFLIDCLNCSKQVPMDGLHYGQKQKRWCMFCNEKLLFSIEGVKIQAISSIYVVASKNTQTKKTEKKKDPLIKEGEPLPDFGICKHYKKSHRWLRFPCCGRLYPCDICHDEKENDHEMKFASRMICGFCSKEQPYSKDKPCILCSGTLTAKGGTHWEGGKGCRSKVRMARDDKHKYVGSNKTVSKKSQSAKSGKKK